MYARSLVDELNRATPRRHSLLTIFAAESEGVRSDLALDVGRAGGRRLGLSPTAILRLRRLVERSRPAAIVAHGGEPAKYAALAMPVDIPFVYLVIGSTHPLLENPIRRAIRRLYVDRASAIVAVSAFLARQVESELGLEDGEVRIIPNGRDPRAYEVRRSEPSALPHVVLVGHLDEQKRPELFVETIAEIKRRGHEVTAAIIGGGTPPDRLEERAAAHGVELLGERDDVPELLAAADVLLLTSRPPEGMPGVLIEAGLAGIPAVSTDVPGAGEVIEDGVTGFIVGVDDSRGMADALERLIADRDVRLSMGDSARSRCVEHFSIRSSARLWDEVLASVLR